MKLIHCRLVLVLFLLSGIGCGEEAKETGPSSTIPLMESTSVINCELNCRREGGVVWVDLTFTNTSDAAVAILERNLLTGEGLTFAAFEVLRDDESVAYKGPMIKRASPTPGDYRVLVPGEAVRIKTDLGKYYDITKRGHYTVIYKAITSTPDAASLFLVQSNPGQFEIS